MPRTNNMLALAARATEVVFKQRKWRWAEKQLRERLCVQRVAWELEAFPRRRFLYLARTSEGAEALMEVREDNTHHFARLTWADLQGQDWSTRRQLNLVTTYEKTEAAQ